MIRTIWLGFTFLIILAGAGSFRFAFGHFDAANASGIVVSEQNRPFSQKSVQDNLTIADQIPVAYVAPASEAVELAKAAYSAVEALHRTPQPTVAPDVVEREMQEPAAPVVRKARIERPKRKQPKPDAVAGRPPSGADPKACQLQDFDAFRWAFSLPTGCHS